MGPTFNEFGFKRGLGYNWQISLSKPLNEMQKKSSATMSTRFVNSKFSTSNFLLTPIEIFFNFCQKTYEIQKTLWSHRRDWVSFLFFRYHYVWTQAGKKIKCSIRSWNVGYKTLYVWNSGLTHTVTMNNFLCGCLLVVSANQ